MNTISARLNKATAIVLALFVLLTGLSISYSVKQRAETALEDRLKGLIYGILGASDIDSNQQLFVNEAEIPESRLNLSTNGLYAEIVTNTGERIWQSKSTAGYIPKHTYTPIGQWLFERIDSTSSGRAHRMQLSSVWVLENDEELPFFVQVVADGDVLSGQLKRFDRTLWLTLLASAIFLLLLQRWILHKALLPLRDIGKELQNIEKGQSEALSEHVVGELKPLANSINTLISSERNRHEQYRHLLDDLAHSLKTPVSVLKNLPHNKINQVSDAASDIIKTETLQIQDTIQRYLQRAAMRTPAYLAKPVSPAPIIARLKNSLLKIYPQVEHIDLQLEQDFKVRIADTDLYEILGNVLDNACKHGGRKITVTSNAENQSIVIEDNGAGFPPDQIAELLDRGVRADSSREGEGIGLASASALLTAYGGLLLLDAEFKQGARVVLHFRDPTA